MRFALQLSPGLDAFNDDRLASRLLEQSNDIATTDRDAAKDPETLDLLLREWPLTVETAAECLIANTTFYTALCATRRPTPAEAIVIQACDNAAEMIAAYAARIAKALDAKRIDSAPFYAVVAAWQGSAPLRLPVGEATIAKAERLRDAVAACSPLTFRLRQQLKQQPPTETHPAADFRELTGLEWATLTLIAANRIAKLADLTRRPDNFGIGVDKDRATIIVQGLVQRRLVETTKRGNAKVPHLTPAGRRAAACFPDFYKTAASNGFAAPAIP